MPLFGSDHPIDRKKVVTFLEALRRALIHSIIASVLLAIVGYFVAQPLLVYLQRLTGVELVAYGVADVFFSTLKIALAAGIMAAMPYTLYQVFSILPAYYPSFSRRSFLVFWLASIVLFVSGVVFCLRISLPYGIQFLLSYQSNEIVALISVKTFVSFCFLVLFGFGLIFELPLFMIMLSRLGVVNAARMAGYRRYAILVIAVAAAVLTPTPDIVNMLLMAVPIYLLYEIGLLGMRFWKKPRQ